MIMRGRTSVGEVVLTDLRNLMLQQLETGGPEPNK